MSNQSDLAKSAAGFNGDPLSIDTANNRVGIGTSSPSAVIDARQTSTGGSTQIRVYNTDNSNTTTQTASLFLSPDSRSNGALIFAEKENADFSTSAGRDISLVFSPVLNNTQTERMRIDSAGRVTMPYQPAFDAYYTTNNNWIIGASNTLVFNATTFNQGGHYNTSNGRFTAPVSGVYHFTFYSIMTGNYTNADLNLYVNGGRDNGTDRHFSTNTGSNWNTIGGSNTRYLNAGDYVMVFSRSGATFHGGYWSNFSGHLVG